MFSKTFRSITIKRLNIFSGEVSLNPGPSSLIDITKLLEVSSTSISILSLFSLNEIELSNKFAITCSSLFSIPKI